MKSISYNSINYLTICNLLPPPPISRSLGAIALVTALLTAEPAYADASVTRRKNCTWYQNKFKTNAKIKHCGVLEKFEADDKDCGGIVYAWYESYGCYNAGRDMAPRKGEAIPYTPMFLNGTRLWENAKAYAETGYNTGLPLGFVAYVFGTIGSYKTPYGRCTSWARFCNGNDEKATSYVSAFPIVEPVEPVNAFNTAVASSNSIEFDETGRLITIKGFKAVLRNLPYDRPNDYSAISINVFNSAADSIDNLIRNDDEVFRDKVLLKSRVLLNNGKLTVDGALRNASVTTKDSSGVQIAILSLDEITLKVDANVNPANISITAGSDVGNLGYGISEKYMPGTQSQVYDISSVGTSTDVLVFSNFSNPVVNSNFDAELELSSSDNVSVGLYDAHGNVVRSIHSGMLSARSRRIYTINTTGLRIGTYYLRVVGSSRTISRRVILE